MPITFFLCHECAYRCKSSDFYCDRCHILIDMKVVLARQLAASVAIPVKKPNNKFFFDDKGKLEEVDRKLDSYIRRGRGGGTKRWLHG